MGRAQVMQAEAAGIEPSVRMNPILLKPTSDVGSQVIVNGEVRQNMRAAEYFKYKKSLIPDIMAAYNSLAAENDIIGGRCRKSGRDQLEIRGHCEYGIGQNAESTGIACRRY